MSNSFLHYLHNTITWRKIYFLKHQQRSGNKSLAIKPPRENK
ncbi:hypothetical protein A676_04174 [Salmonella enterica subsp. enterica serovar Enteritidis str. 2010K-0262]|nr:hypothetical protein A672_04286 [Salmonella enterica subsp. enterica serovar Enteritidis str. 08-1080]EPI79665.1 hypothetical protein A675_04463 [Salmonella enterica subsp. enterica serovar Enteritidis str. 2009K1726]EPI79882.1 hypothetical protein A676_04174 [Salmonella enterica subsp. enterica serovar Enteritidis str. 2010K-0262]EPI86357.1 hypothetical protein A674_02718 [Salmonella enterica subsp. enterica serovar Enteritidis str. 2009K1651]EPI95055.1 hypothetical protein A679_04479 [Salm